MKLTRNLQKSRRPSVGCIPGKYLPRRVRLFDGAVCLQVVHGTPVTNASPDQHPCRDELFGDAASQVTYAPATPKHSLVC